MKVDRYHQQAGTLVIIVAINMIVDLSRIAFHKPREHQRSFKHVNVIV
jgi:hypothetical protein